MNTSILGLLAETSIHPGAGESAGFIDMPVAREGATGYPVIVGSSLKGALLDLAREGDKLEAPARDRIFGKPEIGRADLPREVPELVIIESQPYLLSPFYAGECGVPLLEFYVGRTGVVADRTFFRLRARDGISLSFQCSYGCQSLNSLCPSRYNELGRKRG